MRKEFEKRASCISDQYSTYTIIDDIKINGKLTLGEDVADLGGLILAYMAWKEDTKGQNLQPLDDLTPEQRFFVGYGQSWCGQTRDETKRMRATVDPHSPDEVSHQRRGLEHAGISGGVSLQGGIADGQSEPLPRVVSNVRIVAGRVEELFQFLLWWDCRRSGIEERDRVRQNRWATAGNGSEPTMPAQAARSSGTSPELVTSFMPATFPSLVIANSMIRFPCFISADSGIALYQF